jgi:hypothetical protein
VSFVYRRWREAMRERVPETAAWIDDPSYDGLANAAMSDLAAFVHAEIAAPEPSETFLGNAVGLWTDMADSDDDDVQALLVSGALELFVDSRADIDALLPRMAGRLRNLFGYTILTYHGDRPPNWFEVDVDRAPDEDAVRDAIARVPR